MNQLHITNKNTPLFKKAMRFLNDDHSFILYQDTSNYVAIITPRLSTVHVAAGAFSGKQLAPNMVAFEMMVKQQCMLYDNIASIHDALPDSKIIMLD